MPCTVCLPSLLHFPFPSRIPWCVCVCVCVCVCARALSHSAMSDSLWPQDLPVSSVHGISQASILEWVSISFSRGSSPPRDWTCISCVSCIGIRFFTCWANGESHQGRLEPLLKWLALEWKLTFSSLVATAEFSKFADIEWSTWIASSFRIWNSSAGIPSPPLALFVVMLPKANLTSHSRMSGSRWVIRLSWLSWSLRSFLYSSVYSCLHLFLLISSASVRSLPFLFFIVLASSLREMFRWYL